MSATILIFLMTVAGLADPNNDSVRLYDDSLTGYTTDPSLPYDEVEPKAAQQRSRL